MPMIASLSSWFGRRAARGARPVARRTLLQVERLETREVPAGIPTVRVGGIVNVGHTNGSQDEPAIAVNPTNPRQLFAFANQGAGAPAGIYASRSSDGGATWTPFSILNPAPCCDPTLAWDSFGNLFVGYLNAATNATVVLLSTDGGATFTTVATLTCQDQPTVTTGAGSVWVTFNTGNLQAVGARVTGLGQVQAFGAIQNIPNSPAGNFGDISIGQNGQVMVVFQQANTGNGPDTIRVSLDPDGLGPAGFTNPTVVTPTNVGGFAPIPAQQLRTIDAETGLAWDRTNGPNRGRVYLIYTERTSLTTADTNIFLRFSDNNGTTWSAARRVNDDATTNSQFFSKIALDQTTGDIAMSWYDCRLDPGSGAFDTDGIANTDMVVFATVGVMGGSTILRNVQVGTGPSNSRNGATVNGGQQFGDYMGLTFDRGVFYPVWTDNSAQLSGNTDRPRLDVATAKITVIPPALAVPRLFYPLRWIYDARTQTYRGHLTLTNVGAGLLLGPATLVFSSLPRGVTVVNASGTRNGYPTLGVGFASLAPNQSIRIPIVVRNPLRLPLSTFYVGFRAILLLPDNLVVPNL